MIKTARTPEENQAARARRAERALQAQNSLLKANVAAEHRQALEQREKDVEAMEEDTAGLDARMAAMAAQALVGAAEAIIAEEGVAGGMDEAISTFEGEGGATAGGGASDSY